MKRKEVTVFDPKIDDIVLPIWPTIDCSHFPKIFWIDDEAHLAKPKSLLVHAESQR
jgi:hypothetical protein